MVSWRCRGVPRLGDVALVLRSKNADPYTITIDIVLPSRDCARSLYNLLDPSVIASLYEVDRESVEIVLVEEARAVKVNIPRRVPAGHPGDRDVYGAQQHAPLLDLALDLRCEGTPG